MLGLDDAAPANATDAPAAPAPSSTPGRAAAAAAAPFSPPPPSSADDFKTPQRGPEADSPAPGADSTPKGDHQSNVEAQVGT